MGKGSFLKGIISNPADCFLFPHQIGDAIGFGCDSYLYSNTKSSPLPHSWSIDHFHLSRDTHPCVTKVGSVDKKISREKVKQNCPGFPPGFDAKDWEIRSRWQVKTKRDVTPVWEMCWDIYSHPLISAWVDFRAVCLCFEAKRFWRD